MTRDLSHPVWDVYDDLRSVRLNYKYYGAMADRVARLNFWTEILVGATTTGSAVGAWAFWNTDVGSWIWQLLLSLSALVALAKPRLGLTKRLKEYDEAIGGYRILDLELQDIRVAISQRKSYGKPLKVRYATARRQLKTLAEKHVERRVDKELLTRCREEVERELPGERFFIPVGD